MSPASFLFVCTGNICRSPLAHGVFQKKVEERGLGDQITVDSAGTHRYHIGEKPDPRAQEVAKRHGYDLSNLRARQVRPEDFEAFDHILYMDAYNESCLRDMCPSSAEYKLDYLMGYAGLGQREVVDPYYGHDSDFECVIEMIEKASDQILDEYEKSA